MSLQLFSSSPFVSFLCFLLVVFVNIQLSLGNADVVELCGRPFICGNITAGYPFWDGADNSVCGYIPDFKLNCENDNTTLLIDEVKYFVFNITEKTRVLDIARKDFYDHGICPSNKSNLRNANISEPFEILPQYKMITLLYDYENEEEKLNCSSAPVNDKDDDTIIFGGLDLPHNVSVNVTVPTKISVGAFIGNLSSLQEALEQGFKVKWKAKGSEFCDKCLQSGGRCGYPSALGPLCYCKNGPVGPFKEPCPTSSSPAGQPAPGAHPGDRPKPVPESTSKRRRNITIGIAASSIGVIIMLSIVLIAVKGRKTIQDNIEFLCNKKTEKNQNIEAFVRNYGSLAPKRYNYSDVKKMTKSFSNKLGQGGCSYVYKGALPDGRLVAVKMLKESKNKGEEFINEVTNISGTSHVNIVTLLGFCYERNKSALIYEFMSNGSLDKFIYDQEPSSMNHKLEWKIMYQIAVGIAKGLEYLHRGCNIKIVHFDIKPHNILLDENFCPKISDFGLAKQDKRKNSNISMLDARETIGYIAPEVYCRSFGGVSHKSDVYSYGMMILEMTGETRNIDSGMSQTSEISFLDSIYKHLELSSDYKPQGVITEEEKDMAKKMLLVGLWCIQTNPSHRPSISKVVEMLEGSLENLQIPPKANW